MRHGQTVRFNFPPKMKAEALRKLKSLKATEENDEPSQNFKSTEFDEEIDIDVIAADKKALKDELDYLDIEMSGGVDVWISDISLSIARNELGSRMQLYHEYARCCHLAHFLIESDEHWNRFQTSTVWLEFPSSQPAPDDRKDVLRFILLRAVTGFNKRGKKRASKVFCGLNPLVLSNVATSDIPDVIEKSGGIEALAKKNSKGTSASVGKTSINDPSLAKSSNRQLNRFAKLNIITSSSRQLAGYGNMTKLRITATVLGDLSGCGYLRFERVQELE